MCCVIWMGLHWPRKLSQVLHCFSISNLAQATLAIDSWRVTANRHQSASTFQKERSSPEMKSSYNLMKKRLFRYTFQMGCIVTKPFTLFPPHLNTPSNVFLFFHSIVSLLPSSTILHATNLSPITRTLCSAYLG